MSKLPLELRSMIKSYIDEPKKAYAVIGGILSNLDQKELTENFILWRMTKIGTEYYIMRDNILHGKYTVYEVYAIFSNNYSPRYKNDGVISEIYYVNGSPQ